MKDDDDVQMFADKLMTNKITPIFSISNVTGQGLPKLKEFLACLNSRIHVSGLFQKPTDPVEFYIDGIYMVTGVGLVVAGTLKAGTVTPNMILNLGPDKSGVFKPVQVKSIHHKRLPVEVAHAG